MGWDEMGCCKKSDEVLQVPLCAFFTVSRIQFRNSIDNTLEIIRKS